MPFWVIFDGQRTGGQDGRTDISDTFLLFFKNSIGGTGRSDGGCPLGSRELQKVNAHMDELAKWFRV